MDDKIRLEKLSLQLSEYKQNYPLVLEENRILKQQLEESEARREVLEERINEVLL